MKISSYFFSPLIIKAVKILFPFYFMTLSEQASY